MNLKKVKLNEITAQMQDFSGAEIQYYCARKQVISPSAMNGNMSLTKIS